jgi:hypothetical protein
VGLVDCGLSFPEAKLMIGDEAAPATAIHTPKWLYPQTLLHKRLFFTN